MQLAAATFVSRSSIACIETARQNADRSFWERADAATGANGSLLALYDHIRNTNVPPAPPTDAQRLTTAVGCAASNPSVARLDRVPSLGQPTRFGTSDPDLGLGDAQRHATDCGSFQRIADIPITLSAPTPRAIGWVHVEHVRYITQALAAAENLFGGQLSSEAAGAQLRYSMRLLRANAADDVRRAMFEAVGNLAAVVGFAAFDVCDYTTADRCFRLSLECADEARSWPLRANTLSDMARLAMYTGDLDEALSFIELAQVRQDRISGTSRAMLGAVRAQVLARMGRHREALAQVEAADRHFAERDVREDPPWICYYDEAEHQGSTAKAMIPAAVAGKHLVPTRRRLEAAVRLHDQDHPRSRAFSRVRLAALLMQAGDPYEAADIGYAAVTEVACLGSRRLAAEVAHLARVSAKHRTIPTVAHLRDAIFDLVGVPGDA